MSWTSETNIKGSPGPQGPQGIPGPPGTSGTGTGNVNGPASAVADDIAVYNGPSGTIIKDGGVKVSDLVTAAALPETIDDRVAALLVAGSNVTLAYNDAANSLTINSAGGGTATSVTVTPAGNISSTNVQLALQELDTEKEPVIAGGTTSQFWRGDKTWQVPAGGGGGSTVYTSDTPPAGAPDNSLWFETDTAKEFIRLNDGNSTQWVQLTSAGVADAVRYGGAQTLTAPQQKQARQNIAADSGVFHVDRNGVAQTVTANAANKLAFNNELRDGNSWYDTTLARYTPQIAGMYFFYLCTTAGTASGTGQTAQNMLYKNGISNLVGPYMGATSMAGASMISSMTGAIFMNGTTDYIEAWIFTAPGVTSLVSPANAHYFGGYRVGD